MPQVGTQETAQDSSVLVGGVQDTGNDLGDFITQILDGYPRPQPDEDVEPEPDTVVAAGSTPAEHQSTDTATPAASEDALAQAATGSTPVDKPATPSDSAAEPTTPETPGVPEADLTEEQFLAQTKPFEYTTDNEGRVFDGIRVTEDGAGIIAPEAMALLKQRLSQGEHDYRQSRDRYEQLQRYERVAEWNYQDGRKVTGFEALLSQALSNVEVRAKLAVLEEAFNNPAQLRALIAGYDDKTDTVHLNQAVWNSLQTKAENLSLKAQAIIASRFGQASSAVMTPAAMSQQELATQAPVMVRAVAQRVGTSVHPDDASRLAEILPNFVRPATADDVRLDPSLRVGEQVVDQGFDRQVAYLASLRNQAKQLADDKAKGALRDAQVAAEAKRRNDAKLANATPARQPAKTPIAPATPARPKTQLQQRLEAQDQLNTMRERLLAQAVPR